MVRFSLAATLLVMVVSTDLGRPIKFEYNAFPLPKPLSDLTAVVLKTYPESKFDDDVVILAGGCDDPLGNVYNNGSGLFECASLSFKSYAFRPSTGKFDVLKDMPRARYRHASAVARGKVWVVGGRDEDDKNIPEIDVYDPVTKEWSTPGSLPLERQTSDNAAFTDPSGNHVYVTGGYEQNYTALSATYRFNAQLAFEQRIVSIEPKDDLNRARGDVQAVNAGPRGELAYVTGGFTDDACLPLNSVEKYDVDDDEWTTAPSLNTGRSDKALVELNGKIYALGGETQYEGACDDGDGNDLAVGEQTVAVDDVEVLENDEWVVKADLPDHKFRFVGVAWDATDAVYAFGGQEAYDDSCECYRTTDKVVLYKDVGTARGTRSGATTPSTVVKTGTFGVLLAVVVSSMLGAWVVDAWL